MSEYLTIVYRNPTKERVEVLTRANDVEVVSWTHMRDERDQLRAMLAAAEQPDTVKVSRELLESLPRYTESCMEGGGTAPCRTGEYVVLADVIALLAGGEA